MDDRDDNSDDEGGSMFDPMHTESTGPAKSERDILHEQLSKQLSLQQKMRELAVPTSDELVKARLTELEEPIIIFERRNRLRSLLAERGISQGMPATATAADSTTTGLEESPDQQRPFQTEGPPALKSMRLWMLHDSLARAQARIQASKQKAQILVDEVAEATQLAAMSTTFKKFVVVASEPADERNASGVAFSPKGEWMATTGWSGICKLWHTKDKKLAFELKGHTERANSAKFHPFSGRSQSPTALNLATASADRTVKLWSLESDACLGTLEGHEDRVNRLSFHPSGKYLASSSFDKKYNIYDLEVGKCLISQDGHSRAVFGINWHQDGALLATSGLDAFGKIWDVRTGKSIHLLRGHAKQVLSIEFAPNGYHIATASDDHTVRIWDLRAKTTLYILPAHTHLISEMKYQPLYGNYIVSSGYDGTIKIWSAHDYSLIKSLTANESKITSFDILPTDNPYQTPEFIASTSFDKTWKFWAPDDYLFKSDL